MDHKLIADIIDNVPGIAERWEAWITQLGIPANDKHGTPQAHKMWFLRRAPGSGRWAEGKGISRKYALLHEKIIALAKG